jgi:cysteinyl-tRNA synthetase
MRLFNTLTRQVEHVAPLEPGRIRMYSCGPTVYRYVHIGNLRTFTMADWIRRALDYHGLAVTHIKNITDVGHMRQDRVDLGEDKMIAQALAEGKTPWDIAAFYTDAFLRDEARLRILPAHVYPRATAHIPEMIALTQRLLEGGYAYEAAGNVFFSVKAFPAYGQLSGNLLEYVGQGRLTENEMTAMKRAPEDFPLWKAAEPGRLMAWDSPWGRGFPGWHIECSAMSAKYLGEQLDIHTGGVDNIFPHHEDERAQSEAASGKPFVRLWVHGQHLLADGLKMAKSAGNAYTLADIEARGFEPLALRYFFTTAKYRSRINFTFRALRAAQTALHRLHEAVATLCEAAGGRLASASSVRNHHYRRAFVAAVDDDLNMPRAMAVLWTMLRDQRVAPGLRLGLLFDFDQILGFGLAEDSSRREALSRPSSAEDAQTRVLAALYGAEVPAPILALAHERDRARLSGDFAAADTLRGQMLNAGFGVRDHRRGTTLVPLSNAEALISSSSDLPSLLREPDRYEFSVNVLAHQNRSDLERCIESVARHAGDRRIEIVVLDNGSTDDTLSYLRQLDRAGAAGGVPVRVLFADHDMGFGAGRNATFRSSLGRIIVQLDTSIEVRGDIWTPLDRLLSSPTIGLTGAYGLVTDDLKEFRESAGPDVDAIEGYLLAFRRALLAEVGFADERFRFYRMMDVDYSLEFKRAGYRVVVSPAVAEQVTKHPLREWYNLTPEEQAARSKKNFDLYYRRRHHAQSLLVAHYDPAGSAPWGHDHEVPTAAEMDARFEHRPLSGDAEHTHEHKHWPDHAHTHPHIHAAAPRWFQDGAPPVRASNGRSASSARPAPDEPRGR